MVGVKLADLQKDIPMNSKQILNDHLDVRGPMIFSFMVGLVWMVFDVEIYGGPIVSEKKRKEHINLHDSMDSISCIPIVAPMYTINIVYVCIIYPYGSNYLPRKCLGYDLGG